MTALNKQKNPQKLIFLSLFNPGLDLFWNKKTPKNSSCQHANCSQNSNQSIIRIIQGFKKIRIILQQEICNCYQKWYY